MSSKTSTMGLADCLTTMIGTSYANPGLTNALRRCKSVIHEAEARADPAFEPLIGRYQALVQGISGQIAYAGPGTIASVDRLTEDVERMLDCGHVEARKVHMTAVDSSEGKEGKKDGVQESKKKGKKCVTM